MPLAARALDYVPAGGVVGLGTGRAAEGFVRALGRRVRGGLKVRGVATSRRTETLARTLGIPLVSPEEVDGIDLTVDGADEIDPRLDLIKGYGGALVREKIVAASSRRVLILAGREKLVRVLGARGRLPLEVLPFGAGLVRRALREEGLPCALRTEGGRPFRSDNGHLVFDAAVPEIRDPARLERKLRGIPGVVGTGLFLGLADEALIEDGGRIDVLRRPGRARAARFFRP